MADTGDDRGPGAGTDGTEPDWKFSVDEFTDEPADERSQRDGVETAGDGDAGEEKEGNITGSLTTDEPLEPGDIDPENAFFVLVGVALVAGLILGTIVGL